MYLSDGCKLIIEKLNSNNYDCFVVGGAVRDYVLGVENYDYDLTTQAPTQKIIEIFKDFTVLPTGIKHGTVTIVIDKVNYEVTTYRTDGNYLDNRHPKSVTFTSSLKEDLLRRDFTVNTLCYSDKTGIIDYFNGVEDIKNKVIRAVGDADKRFNEDALRILRALRFASVLNFEIEEKTKQSILKNAHLVNNISKERIFSELKKILVGINVKRVLMEFSQVFFEIIPKLKETYGFEQRSKWHIYDVYRHIVESVGNSPRDEVLRLTTLLHDIEKPSCFFEKDGEGHFYGHNEKSSQTALTILNDLKCDNDTKNQVVTLIKYHDMPLKEDKVFIKKTLNLLGEDLFFKLLQVKKADNLSQNLTNSIVTLKLNEKVEKLAKEIIENKECFNLKNLDVSGLDLQNLGYKGKEISLKLNRILNLVMEKKLQNNREIILKYLTK